jgi:hypothetical protein
LFWYGILLERRRTGKEKKKQPTDDAGDPGMFAGKHDGRSLELFIRCSGCSGLPGNSKPVMQTGIAKPLLALRQTLERVVPKRKEKTDEKQGKKEPRDGGGQDNRACYGMLP